MTAAFANWLAVARDKLSRHHTRIAGRARRGEHRDEVRVIEIQLSREDASRQLSTLIARQLASVAALTDQSTRHVTLVQVRNTRMLQNYFLHLLSFHSLLRWLVLAAGLIALLVALSGWSGRKWREQRCAASCSSSSSPSISKVPVGLLLYFFASPTTHAALSDMSAAMSQEAAALLRARAYPDDALAVVAAHLGGALSRKGRTDAKYRGAAIAFAISLLLILAGIPWLATAAPPWFSVMMEHDSANRIAVWVCQSECGFRGQGRSRFRWGGGRSFRWVPSANH